MNKKAAKLKNILPNVGMAILAAYSLYAFVTMYGLAFFANFAFLITQPLFVIPGLALLSMFAFSIMYLYALYKRKTIPTAARNITYIFTALILIAFVLFAIGIIQDIAGVYCAGFFGVQTSCLSNQYLTVGIILLMHPFVYLGYLILVLLGIKSLITNLYRRK